jgi:hypothetical protein
MSCHENEPCENEPTNFQIHSGVIFLVIVESISSHQFLRPFSHDIICANKVMQA